eukprot:TRINITY_DN87875_c0_g1_i1.p1 TRINITY_DN87875_c0_g1~~TRINITY_DN87875_c0_g1_i1.p1  ORF type:complete len:355 (+),score=73.36 TRINITY_DN87875_c0_g1_i1:43-1107(+)
MKCAVSQGLLLLFLAVFSIVPIVSSSHFRGVAFQTAPSDAKLLQRVNVSQIIALEEVDRASSDHDFSVAAKVAVEKWLESYELDEVPAGAKIPDKVLLNYKTSIGTLLYHAAVDEKSLEHGTELLPPISRMMKSMPNAQLIFADDKQCRAYIARTHSEELATFFDRQTRGMYKSDLCRFAMLYEEGGYYFDNDVEVLADLRSMDIQNASFVSVTEFPWHGKVTFLHEAFVAATPRHPAVKLMLDLFLQFYHLSLKPGWHDGRLGVYGPEVAGIALMRWLNLGGEFKQLTGLTAYTPPGRPERRAYLFKETNQIKKYQLPDRTAPGKCCCNFFFADQHNPLAWAHARGNKHSKEC